jgi:hypothetical protein
MAAEFGFRREQVFFLRSAPCFIPMAHGFAVIVRTATNSLRFSQVVQGVEERRGLQPQRNGVSMKKRPGKFYYQAVFYEDASGIQKLPGVSGRAGGYAPAYHRENTEVSPFCIPNELISAALGTFLGLPIPPFTVTHFNRRAYFSSLNFNPDKHDLPRILADICITRFPRLCTGILFFDVLIANEDRHDENVAVDNVADPKQIVVYDHERAMFGGTGSLSGLERLHALKDRLGITGGPVTGGTRSCFLTAINTLEYFNEWRLRVLDIPDWFIEDICNAAVGLGIDKSEAREAKEFLVYRKRNIVRIIQSCGDLNPAIAEWRPNHVLFDA